MLGPLVVAGVSMTPAGARRLRGLGVRDSKLLSPAQREALYPEIVRASNAVHFENITPPEIDFVVNNGRRLRKLNYLEAVYFAKVIDRLGASSVTVDASDIVPSRFRGDILDHLKTSCSVSAFHKADRDYAVVSAASIVAKVERDRAVEELRLAVGDFGSGYPSDPVTRNFFTERIRRGEPLPGFVRKSWKTWFNIEQTLITRY